MRTGISEQRPPGPALSDLPLDELIGAWVVVHDGRSVPWIGTVARRTPECHELLDIKRPNGGAYVVTYPWQCTLLRRGNLGDV